MCIFTFTVDDLLQRYGCKNDSDLASLLGFSKGTVSLWRSNGLPDSYQRFLNVESSLPESRKKKTFKSPKPTKSLSQLSAT
ncbi:helix-turn-helix domain containing protein [Acinetobacter radioresistens]|uniref:helix-turn-helix domain-containing protein n=1 Tax=Acinetobacter radioresistens TaxID=40216 RepID=UPI002247FF38|nr:helix-turn-helix domain-containing protein [Acinetobacter radioresistens]MCX0332056.1 helix-turn-helix domain containing protein [Acinetobacter radioresistens]